MSRVKLVTQKGRDVIIADLKDIENENDIIRALDEVEQIIRTRTQPFCTLYDITNSYVTPGVTKRAKALSEFVDTTGLSRGSATVGVNSPTKRVIGNFLKPSMHFAKNTEEALAHLTSSKLWEK